MKHEQKLTIHGMERATAKRIQNYGEQHPSFHTRPMNAWRKWWKHEHQLKELIRRKPELSDGVGMTLKGLYRHNPDTGFNERIHATTGAFIGHSPY